MRSPRQVFIPLILLIGIVTMGLVLPMLLIEDSPEEPGLTPVFATRTQTPFQPLMVTPVGFTDTASPVQDRNCTYHVYYWLDHTAAWPEEMIIAGEPYTREEAITLLATESDDTPTNLIKQLYLTYLNILNGSSLAAVEGVIVDASAWLEAYPPGTVMSEFNQERGNTYVALLQNYNNGEAGPGSCPGQPPTPPAMTATFTVPPPTETPVPTATRLIPTARPVFPTATRKQNAPPPPPPPTNTQAPPPPPTNTQPPPPPPTSTQAPPPTSAPTQPIATPTLAPQD